MTATLSATELLSVPRAGVDYDPAFAAITPERLKDLLYGELRTAEDLVELETIAAATGVDPLVLIPATGEPGHDPRTGLLNPRAVCESADDEDDTDDEDFDPETVFDGFRSVVDDGDATASGEVDEARIEPDSPVGMRGSAAVVVDGNLLADLDAVSVRNPVLGRWFATHLRRCGLLPEGATP